MSQFIVNQDMFGRYCKIKTDFSESMHTYKIVALIESNSYCDVPLYCNSEPTSHKDVVPVLLVIHCGIDETNVKRVALSDCEIQPIADIAEWVHLPCNIGKTVYFIRNGKIIETVVEKIVIKKTGTYLKLSCNAMYETSCKSIGKTVFFDRKEAEKSMERMKENKRNII